MMSNNRVYITDQHTLPKIEPKHMYT